MRVFVDVYASSIYFGEPESCYPTRHRPSEEGNWLAESSGCALHSALCILRSAASPGASLASRKDTSG